VLGVVVSGPVLMLIVRPAERTADGGVRRRWWVREVVVGWK
jgi:hypothetical protein